MVRDPFYFISNTENEKWYGFGTVENGDPQTSFLSGFAGTPSRALYCILIFLFCFNVISNIILIGGMTGG